MKNVTSSVVCAAAIILLGFGSISESAAAEISPALEAQLSSAGRTDLISAIVILESPVDIRALDLRLHAEGANLARRHAEIIGALKYNAAQTQPSFQAELETAKNEGRVAAYTLYWIENLFVVQATKEFILSLQNRGDVASVTENFRAESTDPNLSEAPGTHEGQNPLDILTLATGVRACGAYRVNTELGITGQGTLVANLDTGVDGNHPALASRWRGLFAPWQECWRDAIGGGTSFPNDSYIHGTPVMGTMVGRQINGEDTTWIGCAPNARWIADNAIGQGPGQEFSNDIIDAFQWFADPDGDPNTLEDVPDVIENNWGVSVSFGYPQCYDAWNTAILNCEAAGPVITWSAGAEGPSGVMRSPAIYSLNAYQIFTTGTVDASGYPNSPYPIADFSTRGPTPCTPAIPDNIKPEIVAPGISVYTAAGTGYTYYSGASFADAHVAGVVALMREACPDCDYITIKQTLMSTAIDSGYGPTGDDNTYGHGFIDAYHAVLAVIPGIRNLTIHVAGDDVILRWSPLPLATSYQVFTSSFPGEPWTLLDSTTSPMYTHVNGTNSSILFYNVIANLP